MSIKFTIAIPCYKQAQYLEVAILSALQQSQEKEIIIINDGSPDDTLKIANDFAQRYDEVKVINQSNKGLASARNSAIMHMTGDYFFPLDSDDIMMDGCLLKIAAKAFETNADVIAPSIRCFMEDGASQDTIIMPNPSFDDFKEGNRLPYCCAIKREVLLEVGGYSPKMDTLGGYEDLWMWYALMLRGKTIATIQEPLVMYRVKAQSMIKEAQKNHGALWAQIIKDFPEAAPHYNPFAV